MPSGSGKAVVERSRRSLPTSARKWWHFGTGALLGGLVFVWIYGGAYLEHRAFPEAQLVDAAVTGRSFNADSVTSPLKEFFAYQSLSSFAIALVIALLALVPGAGATRTMRIFALWGLAISIAVLLIPVRLGEFSLWMSVVAPLPGFAAIRDPTRIIYVYELAVVFGAALFMSRFARGAPVRLAVSLTLLLVLVSQRRYRETHYRRAKRLVRLRPRPSGMCVRPSRRLAKSRFKPPRRSSDERYLIVVRSTGSIRSTGVGLPSRSSVTR